MESDINRIVDALPGLVWAVLPDGQMEYLNQCWSDFTGLAIEQLQGRGWHAAIHPEDLPRLLAHWRPAPIAGLPLEAEARLRAADGTYRWFLFRAYPVTDRFGQVARWCGLSIDIHDRRQAEQAQRDDALRQSQARLAEAERDLQLMIDSIPVFVAAYQPDGTRSFVNRPWLEYMGMSPEEATGASAKTFPHFHPDDAAALDGAWRASLATGEPFVAEARVRRADGQYRWHTSHRIPLRDGEGNIVRWYSVGIDIEDRKRAEEALRQSEGLLAKGQEASLTGTFLFYSATGEFTWSEQLYRIYQFEPGVRPTFALIATRYHPQDAHIIAGVAEQVQRGVTHFDYSHRLMMPDGSTKYIHVVAHGGPARQGGGLEYFGAVQDVTQRRMAEEARDKARSELAQATRVMSLGTLTASIAHEVNQPLAGIIMNATTCLRMLGNDPPNVDGARETTRRTLRDGQRATEVIARLRALFSNKAPTAEIVDLCEATREVLALVASDLLRNRVTLRTAFSEEPLLVSGDRVQLQQVILNLVRNAVDAMSGVHDRPRSLDINATPEGEDRVRLIVKDAGTGFEPDTAAKLFDAFYTTKNGGMGIGLSLSRSIIESHDGTLWAESDGSAGATFFFSVPRTRMPASASSAR